jgi:hypothetical protein
VVLRDDEEVAFKLPSAGGLSWLSLAPVQGSPAKAYLASLHAKGLRVETEVAIDRGRFREFFHQIAYQLDGIAEAAERLPFDSEGMW